MPQLADTALKTVIDENSQLSQQQLQELLQQLDAWSLDQVNQKAQLVRVFKFNNYTQALDFANQIGNLAEQENHHPSILVEWGKVTLRWWTHKIGGLHINDFIMAARSQRIYENRE